MNKTHNKYEYAMFATQNNNSTTEYLDYEIANLSLQDQMQLMRKIAVRVGDMLDEFRDEISRLDFIAGVSQQTIDTIKKHNLMRELMELVVQKQSEEKQQ